MQKELHIQRPRIVFGRFLFLLISIVLLLTLRPFLEDFVRINVLMDIFFSVVLISGVYAVSERKDFLVIALLIAIPAAASGWLTHLVMIPSLGLVKKALAVLFFAYTAFIVLSHLFRKREVTADIITGAVCVYFLIGLMWGFAFSLLETVHPGSFIVGKGLTGDTSQFLYYSFVTLTTLGYGDISPLSAQARSLAFMEAVMGQLYLAILIARLVGIHIAQSIERGLR